MTTLAKGLTVLAAFGRQRPAMTLSEAADVAWPLARDGAAHAAHARAARLRGAERAAFTLTSRVLELGFAYLSAQNWIDQAPPLMKDLSERLQRVLLGGDSAGNRDRLCRAHSRRAASCRRRLRSARGLPAFHTSLGRVQLGFLDDRNSGAGCARFASSPTRHTTITDLQALFERVRPTTSRAFPSSTRSWSAACARSRCRSSTARRGGRRHQPVSTHSTRTTRNEMRDVFLPEFRKIAAHVSQ